MFYGPPSSCDVSWAQIYCIIDCAGMVKILLLRLIFKDWEIEASVKPREIHRSQGAYRDALDRCSVFSWWVHITILCPCSKVDV